MKPELNMSSLKHDTIFVGLNPSRKKISSQKNTAYIRWCEWLDYLGLDRVTFINLSYDVDWDFKFSSLDRTFICTNLENYSKIVAWGDRVSGFLNRLGFRDHFVVAHPSGLNRKINDHKYVFTTLDECKEYLNE